LTKVLILKNQNIIMMEIELVVRLVIALLLGGLVGLERELRHKPAGLRTHMIVSIGACLFTLISIYSFNADPARVASGIVTGIGFIGAGTIIATQGKIYGITTAASLWVVASIGLAVGTGSYLLALVTSVIVFLVLLLQKFEKKIEKKK
jgi:putative Mg2+ transporter-C (MgtC) family protein